jgi:hypothetical protein
MGPARRLPEAVGRHERAYSPGSADAGIVAEAVQHSRRPAGGNKGIGVQENREPDARLLGCAVFDFAKAAVAAATNRFRPVTCRQIFPESPSRAGNISDRHRRCLQRRTGAQKPRDRGHRGRRRQRAVTTPQCRGSRRQVQARGIARGGVTTAGGLPPSPTALHPIPVRSACSLPLCSGLRARARTAGAACCAPHARSGTAASRCPHRRCP